MIMNERKIVKTRVSSISWPDDKMRSKAQDRARKLGLSFSKYLNQLVSRDLKTRGEFILSEMTRENEN